MSKSRNTPSPKSDNNINFVELSLREEKHSSLQKASLTFSDFSFSIEGVIKSGVLLEILKILEQQSC